MISANHYSALPIVKLYDTRHEDWFAGFQINYQVSNNAMRVL